MTVTNYQSAIIHLSDTEFGSNNRAYRDESADDPWLRDADIFVKNVQELLEHYRVDKDKIGLVLTGDITTSGGAFDTKDGVCEFDLAFEILSYVCDQLNLNIPVGRRAVIPGNHDVNRSACQKAFQKKYPDVDVSAKLSEKQIRFARMCPEKLEDFCKFFEKICGTQFVPCQPVPFPEFLELGVAMIGLDSTFPCTFRKEDNYGILHDKQITQAKKQLRSLLQLEPNAVPIAVFHHSVVPAVRNRDDMSFLHDEDRRCVDLLLDAGFQVSMCGHEHKRTTPYLQDKLFNVLVAGTFGVRPQKLIERYNNTDVTNRYEILLINSDDPSRLRYQMIDPMDPLRRWVQDSGTTNGEAPLILRRRDTNGNGTPKTAYSGAFLTIGDSKVLTDGQYIVCMGVKGPIAAVDMLETVSFDVQGKEDAFVDKRVSNKDKGFLCDFILKAGSYDVRATFNSSKGSWSENQSLHIGS